LMHCTEDMWLWYEQQFLAAGYTLTRTKARPKRPKPGTEVVFSCAELTKQLDRMYDYRAGRIPATYMRLSVQQRMELLEGLLDIALPVGGDVRTLRRSVPVWCKTDTLRDQVLELIRSLGYVAV